jgi:hypothetical protein
MPNAILDPTGRTSTPTAPPSAAPRARRRPNLTGARIGLLDNTKRNAAALLAEIGKLLVAEHGAAGVALTRTKAAFALPVPEALLAEYVAGCDVVVTAVGDCGSCSASAVADGVLFEAAGVPAAVICSDAFVVTADAMARRRGAPGYRYLTTPHPVAVLGSEQVAERAKDLLPGVVALLTGART